MRERDLRGFPLEKIRQFPPAVPVLPAYLEQTVGPITKMLFNFPVMSLVYLLVLFGEIMRHFVPVDYIASLGRPGAVSMPAEAVKPGIGIPPERQDEFRIREPSIQFPVQKRPGPILKAVMTFCFIKNIFDPAFCNACSNDKS